MSVYVDIEKRLGSFFLKVRFEAENGTIALLGASGCGKSMTLKCIVGIEKPDRGRIVVDGVTLFDSANHIDLPPQERRVGLMFQNYALFPNMTVLQNIRAGANREKNRAAREAKVRQAMARFELTELAGRYPAQLSGGQQQRVALARILVSEPRLLLLDEPFSALDSHLRFRLEQDVRKVLRSFEGTTLLVSHDRDEVFRMADSVVVMNHGSVDVCGRKKEVFAHPKTKASAMLTGCKNISPLEPCGEYAAIASDWGVKLTTAEPIGHATHLGIRMHDICHGAGENSIPCRVVEEIENPFSYTVMLCPKEADCKVPIGWEIDKETWHALRAEDILIYLPPQAIVLLEDK